MKTQKRNLELKKMVVSQLSKMQKLQLKGGRDDEGDNDSGSGPNTMRSQCLMC